MSFTNPIARIFTKVVEKLANVISTKFFIRTSRKLENMISTKASEEKAEFTKGIVYKNIYFVYERRRKE